jgi:dTDP-4-dehydrorhamnose reductase
VTTVLVTGAGGQLAGDLVVALAGTADVHAFARADLDITDAHAVAAAVGELEPDVVYNCAAFHNVDACEGPGAEQAWAVNVEAVRSLAEACAEVRAKLVQFSTNYVFDGERDEPYSESDMPQPRSVYAITKLAGEHTALAYAPRSLVVRTAGLYGAVGTRSKGGNFVQRMLARAGAGQPLRLVADQRLTPTYTADLARATVDAVASGLAGVVHLTNGGSCSWHAFTTAILANAGLDIPVEATVTTIVPGGAARPLNGVLVSERVPPLRAWDEALADYMATAPSSVRESSPRT